MNFCTNDSLDTDTKVPFEQNVKTIQGKIRHADFDNKIDPEKYPRLLQFCENYLTVVNEKLRATSDEALRVIVHLMNSEKI